MSDVWLQIKIPRHFSDGFTKPTGYSKSAAHVALIKGRKVWLLGPHKTICCKGFAVWFVQDTPNYSPLGAHDR